jgi:hypothetical protein
MVGWKFPLPKRASSSKRDRELSDLQAGRRGRGAEIQSPRQAVDVVEAVGATSLGTAQPNIRRCPRLLSSLASDLRARRRRV